jgi:Spy/CpxP family protein refolding chaperone
MQRIANTASDERLVWHDEWRFRRVGVGVPVRVSLPVNVFQPPGVQPWDQYEPGAIAMKRLACLIPAILLMACSSEVTSPDSDVDGLFDSSAILSYDAAGLSGPGRYLAGLHRLPDNLKLTAAQTAAIDAAVQEFLSSTAADREALAAIFRAAREAQRAGKSAEEVRQIMAQGAPYRDRIAVAEQALLEKILGILTPEQKTWLEGQRRDSHPCALTDAQRTQIAALIADFEVNNRADLEAVKAAHEQARQALLNGATREQVRAILEAVKPAIERLAAAQAALQEAILGVLTPEQREAGCYAKRTVTTSTTSKDRRR